MCFRAAWMEVLTKALVHLALKVQATNSLMLYTPVNMQTRSQLIANMLIPSRCNVLVLLIRLKSAADTDLNSFSFAGIW